MNTAQRMNGFRFAELARGESLCSPDTCDHCGREHLKKTIKLISPEGRVVWFGVGCAANATGLGLKEIRSAKASAERVAAEAERLEQQAKWKEEDNRWQSFLDGAIPTLAGDRARQIEALGSYPLARQQYKGTV